jgi:hypothetical protein
MFITQKLRKGRLLILSRLSSQIEFPFFPITDHSPFGTDIKRAHKINTNHVDPTEKETVVLMSQADSFIFTLKI